MGRKIMQSELSRHIAASGKTQLEVAEEIGISFSRFNAKVNGTNGAKWYQDELRRLKESLALDDKRFLELFFAESGPCAAKERNALAGCIVEAGLTQAEAAAGIGISLHRFNAKLNKKDGARWIRQEMQGLKNLLGMSDEKFMEVFFKEG